MKQIKAKILRNERIAGGFYRMRVASPFLAKESKPGQFVEVRCSAGTDPLLRRPLGIHRIVKGGIELLYEVVGKGTELLSYMEPGSELDVIGPLGNGFTLHPTPPVSLPILIAGGNGVAPLLALGDAIVKNRGETISVLIGACKKSHVLCENEFKKIGAKVTIATEDGSVGHKGLVTDLLRNLLTTNNRQPATIYACGPTGMLKAVSGIARDHHLPCQVSLEERMACGVGVCLGCPVRIKRPGAGSHGPEYKMVCKDGPVFNAEEIAW